MKNPNELLALRIRTISVMNKLMRVRFKDYIKVAVEFTLQKKFSDQDYLQPVCKLLDLVNFGGDLSKIDWYDHDKKINILKSIDEYPDDLTVGDLIALSKELKMSDINNAGKGLSIMSYKSKQLAEAVFIEPIISIGDAWSFINEDDDFEFECDNFNDDAETTGVTSADDDRQTICND